MQAYEEAKPTLKLLTPQLSCLIRAFYLCGFIPLLHHYNSWLILCEVIINSNPRQQKADGMLCVKCYDSVSPGHWGGNKGGVLLTTVASYISWRWSSIFFIQQKDSSAMKVESLDIRFCQVIQQNLSKCDPIFINTSLTFHLIGILPREQRYGRNCGHYSSISQIPEIMSLKREKVDLTSCF